MTKEAFDIAVEKRLARAQQREFCEATIKAVFDLMAREHYDMPLEHKARLVSHLCLMVARAFYGGTVPLMNDAAIAELSPQALKLSERVLTAFPNLGEAEKYLLAVHFDMKRLEE